MAKPTSENEVTVRRLSDVIVGVWDKVKANTVSDVAWDSTNNKLTKTKNGTASDVVTKDTLLSALKGSIADGNTGFVNGDDAYDTLALKADLASPTFTGTPKAPTAATGTNTTQIATTAFVKTAVDTAIAGVADALIYKGTVAGGSTGSYGALTPAANKGDTYKVSTAGKIDGKVVEVGDMLICNTDNTAQATDSNYATIAANWDVIQANIDGAVTGPASSTTGHIATFNGATGKVIKDSGYTIATSVPSGAVFTDTKVTSVGNHYTPATDSSAEKDASGGTATQLPTSSGSSNVQVVTGITMDAKGHVTGVVSKGLYSHDTTYESKSAVSGGDAVSLCTTGEKYTWNNKQNALATQTAYSAKGSATKVPQITTNSLGQVTGITEVTISGVTPASHTHGNITNDGGITATAVTVASGDSLVIVDSSDTNKKVAKSSIAFDGATTMTALTPKGTFEAFAKSSDITTAINALDATVTSSDGTNVQVKVTEADGKITAVNVTTDNTENKNNKVTTWSATTTDAHYPSEKLVKDTIDEQGQVVAAALNDLDDRITECEAITTSGAVLYNTAQTLTTEQKTQARSNIGAGTSNLTIGTTATTAAAGNHTHGNISNAGAITTSAALATGDALVFTDSSDSNKLKKTSITFDGSTATKALTQKGTWETFNNYTHPTSAGNKHIPAGGSSGQFLGWSADGTAAWVSNPNSDTKVTQTLVASDNTSEYPILLAPTGQTATATTTSNFVTGAKYKPSTNTLTVNVSGNAATASAAKSGSALETAINGKAASNHTHTASIAADSSSGTVVSLSANTQYKLTAGGSSVLFKTPANPTVNNGALKIGLNGATATSKFTANQSTDSTLTFSTGSANGTISVDGTDVAVKGLGSAAYTASTAYAASSHAHGNITNAGAIGSASGNAVYTTTNGVLTAGSLATSDPSADGNSLSFIATISQDAKGKITATKKSVTIDTALSSTSTNPVQNKVINTALAGKQNTLTEMTQTEVDDLLAELT